MSTKWSTEEEDTLLEIVKSYEQKGKSKQDAFEVVANIINRTKTACASRYRALKKKDLNPSTLFESTVVFPPTINETLTLENVISYLSSYESQCQLIEQNNQLESMIKTLKENNQNLTQRILQLKRSIEKNQQYLKKLID